MIECVLRSDQGFGFAFGTRSIFSILFDYSNDGGHYLFIYLIVETCVVCHSFAEYSREK